MRPGKTSITGHTFCPSGKVDSDDFSHKKWALACANAQNQTHYLSYKPEFHPLAFRLRGVRLDCDESGKAGNTKDPAEAGP
ncbi:hypothetical protein, partial [Ellagibacter isourolithinifaciens]|uniref:hypothetical protein n=1 Tax=Ellagibacter isourolithinifaciens TaxID=2137581 RepID=UPI003A906569